MQQLEFLALAMALGSPALTQSYTDGSLAFGSSDWEALAGLRCSSLAGCHMPSVPNRLPNAGFSPSDHATYLAEKDLLVGCDQATVTVTCHPMTFFWYLVEEQDDLALQLLEEITLVCTEKEWSLQSSEIREEQRKGHFPGCSAESVCYRTFAKPEVMPTPGETEGVLVLETSDMVSVMMKQGTQLSWRCGNGTKIIYHEATGKTEYLLTCGSDGLTNRHLDTLPGCYSEPPTCTYPAHSSDTEIYRFESGIGSEGIAEAHPGQNVTIECVNESWLVMPLNLTSKLEFTCQEDDDGWFFLNTSLHLRLEGDTEGTLFSCQPPGGLQITNTSSSVQTGSAVGSATAHMPTITMHPTTTTKPPGTSTTIEPSVKSSRTVQPRTSTTTEPPTTEITPPGEPSATEPPRASSTTQPPGTTSSKLLPSHTPPTTAKETTENPTSFLTLFPSSTTRQPRGTFTVRDKITGESNATGKTAEMTSTSESFATAPGETSTTTPPGTRPLCPRPQRQVCPGACNWDVES
ncbi:hypothetical protein C7M84_001109 [Penaeus vannamei]|uniref:Uncharacterized protein n=1 Tax=Penaeus vannamei TaxID=6689 RepID=A0A423TUM1_PENVA|nr:hypothetical protein C7M84_001109 [Penaeus vannamei]